MLAVDLFRANMGFNPAIPIDARHAAHDRARSATCSRAAEPLRRDRASPGSIQPFGPDLAMRYGLYDARGYDYPVERRFDHLWRGTAGPDERPDPADHAWRSRRAESLRTLSLLSVSDVLQARPAIRCGCPACG